MKKIISLILSIALLATLMPTTLFVSASDTAETVTLTVPISKDTFLASRQIQAKDANYANMSERPYLATRRGSANGRSAVILLEASLSGLNIPDNMTVKKAELVMNRIYWGTDGVTTADYYLTCQNSGKYYYVYFYPASKGWDETVSCQDWVSDSSATPKLDSNGDFVDGEYTYAGTELSNYSLLADSAATQKCTYDITDIFKESLGNNVVDETGVVSFMAVHGNSNYDGTCYASTEHSDSTLRPYITLTLEEIPAASVISETLPNNPSDALGVTLDSEIASATATVNGANADSDITYSGNSFSLNYDFAPTTSYSVVDITDVNGAKHNKTYTFTTNDGTDTSIVKKVYITDDTSLCTGNVSNGYGQYVSGYDTVLRWRSRSSADGAYLLYKIPVGSIDIPEGKSVAKIELNFSAYYDSASGLLYSGSYSDAPVTFYRASSNWDETTYMYEWCPDKTTTPAISHTPKITWYAEANGYTLIDATADVNTTVNMAELTSVNNTQALNFDITTAYKNSVADNTVDDNGDFSVLAQIGSTGYWGTGVASAENENVSLRPYVEITLSDKSKENITATEFYHYSISNPSADALSGTEWVYRTNDKTTTSYESNSVVLMRFDLTENYYDSFNVTYTAPYELSHQTIYKFDNDADSAGTSLTYNDLDPVVYNEDNLIGYVSAVGDTTVAAIDVADYANECVANGKDYMCLIIATDGNSCKVSSAAPTAATVKPLETSITLKSSNVQVSGSTLKSIGGRFNTVLENEAASSAVLVETATNTEIENVSFVSLGNKIDIAEPVALEENKDYKIVLKSGAKDIFGETLDADIEIAAFKTTANISADLLVAASDGTVIDVDNFDTITGITSASANDEIYAVCKIVNNYLEDVSALVAIAAYNEDNELVSVSFKLSNADAESTEVCESHTIIVPSDAKTVKAFAWNSTSNKPFGQNIAFNVK